MIRRVARRVVAPIFSRVEARVGPVDARVARLEEAVAGLTRAAERPAARSGGIAGWIDQRFRDEAAGAAAFYEPLQGMIAVGHERRMELLAELDLPDLRDAVCVDYGVGSWGFACVYPRLHASAFAIGIDISAAAIEASSRVSRDHDLPYGDRVQYLTSEGDQIALPDGVADVVFAGESIEHVENTGAFLDELDRILKPDGRLIITTPNAAAERYRELAEEYCLSPEHTALMTYDQLRGFLDPRFKIIAAKGYCLSRHPSEDVALARDEAMLRAAVHAHEDRPDLASNLVLMGVRDAAWPARVHQPTAIAHNAPVLRVFGHWRSTVLFGPLSGLTSDGMASDCLEFAAAATTVYVLLWAHPRGGMAEVSVDGGSATIVDLFSSTTGFRRVALGGLAPCPHRVRIRATGQADMRSEGTEVPFHRAIADLETLA